MPCGSHDRIPRWILEDIPEGSFQRIPRKNIDDISEGMPEQNIYRDA